LKIINHETQAIGLSGEMYALRPKKQNFIIIQKKKDKQKDDNKNKELNCFVGLKLF